MMILKRIRSYISLPSVVTLLLLLSLYPYVFSQLLGLPASITVLLFFFIIFIALNLLYKKKNIEKIPDDIKICIGVQIFVWGLYWFIHSDTTYLTRCFLLCLVSMILYLLHKTDCLNNFVKFYNGFIAFQSLFGAIAFILILFGLLAPFLVFENIDGRTASCYGLTCTNFTAGNFIRMAGYFDEPGAMAYWGIFALLFNKQFMKNKWIEYMLIVTLFFTFSAAYFIQIALFFLFFYTKNIKKSIIPMFVIIFLITLAYVNYASLDANIAGFTIDRFSNSNLGSNRFELAEIAREIFYQNPFFGAGAKYVEDIDYMGDNPYEILAKDGIIGYFFTYLPIIVILFKFGRVYRDVLFTCIILLIGYQQRPFHVNVLHYFILYLFMMLIYQKYIYKSKER
jgi:hypothetical protein